MPSSGHARKPGRSRASEGVVQESSSIDATLTSSVTAWARP